MKPIDCAGTVVSRLAAHLFTLVMDKKIRFGILGFVMASSLGAGLAIPNTVARAATQSTPKIACLQQSAWGFGTVASVCLEAIPYPWVNTGVLPPWHYAATCCNGSL